MRKVMVASTSVVALPVRLSALVAVSETVVVPVESTMEESVCEVVFEGETTRVCDSGRMSPSARRWNVVLTFDCEGRFSSTVTRYVPASFSVNVPEDCVTDVAGSETKFAKGMGVFAVAVSVPVL